MDRDWRHFLVETKLVENDSHARPSHTRFSKQCVLKGAHVTANASTFQYT
jgi:hypothetical protein